MKTSPITIALSSQPGDGQVLGNLLNIASGALNLPQASTALNRVLNSTLTLLLGSQTLSPEALTKFLQDNNIQPVQVPSITVAPR